MRKRVNVELKTAPEWLQLGEDEELLFCGTTPAWFKNPVAKNAKQRECVVLTDKRVVTFCPVGVQNSSPAVTTIPLSQVQAIQTTALSWNILVILMMLVGFCSFVIPGLIILVFMLLNTGPRVNIVAGNLRTEVKFSPSSPALMQQFVTWLDLYVSHR